MGRWNGKTSERGYGADHAAIRRQRVAVYRPGDICTMGGEPLWQPSELLDVPHDHVNGGYLPGLSCRPHNRGEGATRGNQMRGFVLAATGPKGPHVACGVCGRPYSRAARACEMCGAHYHPTYGEQRTCSRGCGVALRRRAYGGKLSSAKPPRRRTCECPTGSPHTCFVRITYRNCASCGQVFVTRGKAITCSAECSAQREAAMLAQYRVKNQAKLREAARRGNDRKGAARGWPRGKGAYNVGNEPWNKQLTSRQW